MRVWELISKLSQAPACAEVDVALSGTEYAELLYVVVEDDRLKICGGDAQIFNEDGDQIGLISEFASTDDDEEEDD